MLATVTSKGQITIPKEIRDFLHIRTNDKLDFVLDGEKVVIAPVKTLLDLRGAVRAKGKGDFQQERARAKAAVARRVGEEMK
jgi:AbrB family looped-hinge helix DNA binding protein